MTVINNIKQSTPATMDSKQAIVIIGVGNILQQDDGVGVHAIRALRSYVSQPEQISIIDAGTLSYELLEWVSQSDHAIIIDAARMKCTPGTIKVFNDEEIQQQFEITKAHSVHQISLQDTLLTSQALYSKPFRVTLIGVEPENIQWGTTLSTSVQAALPAIIKTIVKCIQKASVLQLNDIGHTEEEE